MFKKKKTGVINFNFIFSSVSVKFQIICENMPAFYIMRAIFCL